MEALERATAGVTAGGGDEAIPRRLRGLGNGRLR
jgi:hypothetical protein